MFWFISLEKCCHAQLMADAAAGGRGHETVKIDDDDAAFTYKVSTELGTEDVFLFSMANTDPIRPDHWHTDGRMVQCKATV